jgi:hypothetical protein
MTARSWVFSCFNSSRVFRLTLTALEKSSVNAGITPMETAPSDKASNATIDKTRGTFAPV